MSRLSDTRTRTREAATQLVAQGRQPHELTVDLIYSLIRQGSRTTINDELKAWKEARLKSDALAGSLPAGIAEAMRTLWVQAIEQAGLTFAAERDTFDQARATAEEALAQSNACLAQLREQHSALQQHATVLTDQAQALQTRLAGVEVAHTAAVEDLERVRREAAQGESEARAARETLAANYQATLDARDRAFREELDTATRRLEAAQDRMLQQIDQAREGQRQAEKAVAKNQRRCEEQQAELTELRLRRAEDAQALEQHRARTEALALENQTLTRQVLADRGQIEGLELATKILSAKVGVTPGRTNTRRKEGARSRKKSPPQAAD